MCESYLNTFSAAFFYKGAQWDHLVIGPRIANEKSAWSPLDQNAKILNVK